MFSSMMGSYRGVFSWMRKFWQGDERRLGRQRPRAHYQPRFEQLEDRPVPTTVFNQGELIAAINVANTTGGAQTITLGADITLLEFTPDNTHDGPNGLPQIVNHDNLTIVGDGHTLQRSPIVWDAKYRLFDVGSGATLSLNNMTVMNGLVLGPTTTPVQGGAIFVESGGQLNLNHVNVTGNAIEYTAATPVSGFSQAELDIQGAGIYNAGTTNITPSTLSGNTATFYVTLDLGQGDNIGGNDSNSNEFNFVQDGYNGSSDGQGDGDSNVGKHEGKNNGNGVTGTVTVMGGGIDNEGNFGTGGTVTIHSCTVSNNTASSHITNGNGNGNADGNFDGDGDGLASDLTVLGGAIASNATLNVSNCFMNLNSVTSTIQNGNNNGSNDGQGDGSNNNSGSDCGNGVGNETGALIEVAGGAVYNDNTGVATLTSCVIEHNSASSSVTNGTGNGTGDGIGSTGTDGQGMATASTARSRWLAAAPPMTDSG